MLIETYNPTKRQPDRQFVFLIIALDRTAQHVIQIRRCLADVALVVLQAPQNKNSNSLTGQSTNCEY